MTSGGFGGEEIRQESSWRYAIGIALAVILLSAVFIYYYIGPDIDELGGNVPKPAISEEPVDLVIGGTTFRIPANHTVFPRDRRGGARELVSIYALWPTLSGFSPARREDFVGNAPDARRIDIDISERRSAFSEAERIERLYLPQTIDPRGNRTPFQLLEFEFKEARANVPTNGYKDTVLYLGRSGDTTLAIFCFETRNEIISPDCWRQYELSDTITVTYRFKRPYLEEWRRIDAEVRAFVESLTIGPTG